MHGHEFLTELLIAFAVGGAVVYALRHLRMPTIVGLLLAGALIGPHGLSLVEEPGHVELLAEVGVVLLLFTIGLELSLDQLLRMWRTLLGVGGAQVLLTIAATAVIAVSLRGGLGKPIFWGFLVSLSSTAIVLRLLGDSGKLTSPHGRVALAVLLMQDLAIVPLVLLTPFVAGQSTGMGELAWALGKAAAIVAAVILAARKLIPFVVYRVVATRNRELFLTLLVVLCLGTAWLTSLAGLSLALGAFLAGLAVSESEFSHQAFAEAVPFRDVFGSLFFVSIGMLMNLGFTLRQLPMVASVVLALVFLKALCAALPALVAGYALPVVTRAAFALAQIGEFAFVLAHPGTKLGLLDQNEYQVFLAASVISMLLTPFLMIGGEWLAARMPDKSFGPWKRRLPAVPVAGHEDRRDHVIIVGYGVNGRNLARALRAAGVSYVILELNPETVRRVSAEGEPIHYGDCTRAPILQGLNVEQARIIVFAISDATSLRSGVSIARSLNPRIYILVRTRFVAECEELSELGADEVIPEEFETSIRLFARVLRRYHVPRNVMLDLQADIREGMYQMLRAPAIREPSTSLDPHELHGAMADSFLIKPGSPGEGRSLGELAVRKKTGASVVAVRRDGRMLGNPGADFVLESGDVVAALGDREALDRLLSLLD